MLNVVLHEPEIPANTGNIARTCLAVGARLHLVKPLGFRIDDRQLRRAGLDYWKDVDVRLWESLEELFEATAEEAEGNSGGRWAGEQSGGFGWVGEKVADRRFFFTTKRGRPYYEARHRPGDWLFFGRETKGLPERLLEAHAEQCVTIPMRDGAGGEDGGVRSLNLAVAAGVAIFEAERQFATRGAEEAL